MTCPLKHDKPTFGCSGCIGEQLDVWAKTTFDAWKKTYKPPRCPGSPHRPKCGSQMEAAVYEYTGGKLMATVWCVYLDHKQGWAPCMDYSSFLVQIG